MSWHDACIICQHPRREEIDAALLAHKADGVVSCMFGPSIADIRLHASHLQESTQRSQADVIGRLRKVEAAAWDIYERATHPGPSERAQYGMALKALGEVRQCVATEADLLPPVHGERAQQDLELVIRAELRGNPLFARALFAQLPPADALALLQSATAADARQLIEAQSETAPSGNCKTESADETEQAIAAKNTEQP